jgi:ribosomal protein S18 acetylase RimI-like enzyme
MIKINRATTNDSKTIVDIGNISVEEAHRDSCSAQDLKEYLEKNYNIEVIKRELSDERNIYHIINFNGKPVGFSKVILDSQHPNIQQKNVTKLDRIYILSDFFDLKIGYKLLQFNIELSKNNNQSGIWLFTWTGNNRAVNFYLKNGFSIVGSHNFQVTETHYNPNYQMFLNIASIVIPVL